MSDLRGRLISGKIRLHEGLVFVSEETDDRPCKCCAEECERTVTIAVSFCGMSVEFVLQIPGTSGFIQDPNPPPDSFLLVDSQILCTACGWLLGIGVCAFCNETQQFASDTFTALIPFADSEESAGAGYCPESGAVDLVCFGEQFGIPCITTPTATVS